ncbi:DUF3450 domain-containing protein [Geoalkalibacter halelectricus]|uniref:DUF3450 domain-containing protein n=1 Tax=Geoalkalibacter halelectricus TaxID=2847045 RepID=A0ABY5ZRK5_9BACT|nr:DUF3450 domain-containing protein [Geoalkalibacter halelectricus]MDO3377686.1 DUF3450 domain-containing protein [Geoalkalibacter halelectricus]UWZ81474.1 DUF3450 domain-containing protein [Geoalkalibacter halelectricus]
MRFFRTGSASALRRLGRRGFRRFRALGAALCLVVVAALSAPAAEQVIQVEESTLRQGQASQGRVDALAEEAAKLLREYQQVQRQRESLEVYNDNLEKMIRSQEQEKVSLQRQIENIQVTQREIVPFMLRMLAALDAFVDRDVPFLYDERKARIEGLHALMERADVAVSEKFRQIMEAYQNEADFGRTIETFQGELTLGGEVRSVEFLRIGRLALVYQTLDRRESGFWHPHLRSWEPLDRSYHGAIRQGIRIANRQVAPDLIQVPVVMSEVAR